ncbi:hypothetical protein SAMN06295970_1562 [Noviherbaspirillum suwonense]|uniref:Transposase n=1 Tax=Noviherbaspirillum suwonense TaxID=1224511 RepID=A0ABY1QVQ1_9BURK|nr:hypothetical protein SAMN06295970_1562 [Noviherbaspirillum suwonense]
MDFATSSMFTQFRCYLPPMYWLVLVNQKSFNGRLQKKSIKFSNLLRNAVKFRKG